MALQHRMLCLPTDAEMISAHLAAARHDGRLTFFDASGPIFSCRERDDGALRFAAAMLTEPGLRLAGPSQIARAVGRHRSRVHEYRTRYREGGAARWRLKRRGPRGASKLKGQVLARAQEWLSEGLSNYKVAAQVGVSEQTNPQGPQGRPRGAPAGRRADTAGDGAPPGTDREHAAREKRRERLVCGRRGDDAGGGARPRADRAVGGKATPQFERAESVAKAGVLVALPALLGQGLVEVGQTLYGSLKHGYYGLTSMLLSFGLMALLRIKSTEGLTTHAPGEFGRVLAWTARRS